MTDEIEDNLVSRTTELIKSDHDKEALETADSLEKYKAEDAIVMYTKGIALYENKDFDNALRYLSEAATINKREKRIWYAMGYTLIALNRISEAKDALKYVVGVDHSHVGAHVGLFIIGVLENDKDVAYYHLQKALESDRKATKELLNKMYDNLIYTANIDDNVKSSIKNEINRI
ncbi:tetratricopeptide repeat protein [Candidatus Micrarchaeota archaeon]|nr:tetratricopeptide repeat protein [Candidatus Micrarchaeota archaeon]